jgi:hypothetical protein
MEPNDDRLLRSILQDWKAPPTPPSLEERVMKARSPWWHFLIKGTIPVPVPVALGLALLLALGVWQTARTFGDLSRCDAASVAPARSVACHPGEKC